MIPCDNNFLMSLKFLSAVRSVFLRQNVLTTLGCVMKPITGQRLPGLATAGVAEDYLEQVLNCHHSWHNHTEACALDKDL